MIRFIPDPENEEPGLGLGLGSGEFELLHTSLCDKIDETVFAYLRACRSFPAFLSQLTLNLFEKQTILD